MLRGPTARPPRSPRPAAARVAAGICILAGLLLVALPGLAEMRVYRAQHRTASELLPLAQAALEAEGTAVVDARTNALVLVGTADALDRATALLDRLDRALRTVVLHYEVLDRERFEGGGSRAASRSATSRAWATAQG
jgi:type II secretory pathway component GspD/PulD (secretin)